VKRKTRSILEELNSIGHKRTVDALVETKGINLIESSINLLELIHSNFTEEEAADLEKRFINAIRTRDSVKFKRGLLKIQRPTKPTL
jgi:hypothetical protein